MLMLAGCLAIVLLSVSSVVMWWKRRPAGRLAVPPAPADRRGYMGLAAIVAPLAILYPLVGASILIGLALDVALRRLLPLRQLGTQHAGLRRRRPRVISDARGQAPISWKLRLLAEPGRSPVRDLCGR